MALFVPSQFFDLSNFAHAALFAPQEPVWNAFKKLEAYLNAYSFPLVSEVAPPGVFFRHPEKIFIGEGSVIEPGAYICGPCIIGKECCIRQGAYIRENCILGDRCVVGHVTELKDSILLDGAQAAHFAYVGNSILGKRVNLGAGTKLANLRFDHKNVSLVYQGQRIDTGLRKLGAVCGDGSQTGCNSVTNPGTFLGKGAVVAPTALAKGYIPDGHVVKGTESIIHSV